MDKIKKWQNEIDEIAQNVNDLLYSKYLAEEMEQMIKKNHFLSQNVGSFWEYYKLNYTYFIITKICHQIDRDSRSLSLRNLLEDLLYNHKLITKQWLVSQNPYISGEELGHYFYCKLYLNVDMICKDILELEMVTKEIKTFRNKRIAHIENEKFESSISNKKIQTAVKVMETLVKKYQTILIGSKNEESLLPEPDDWRKSFTKVWIEPTHN